MNETENAKLLLRTLTEVDDKYVSEANDAPVVSNRKRHTKILAFTNVMKFVAVTAACFVIVFIGRNFVNTNKPADPEQNIQDANPVMEVADIEEAEKITGFGFKYDIPEEKYSREIITVYDGNMIDVSFVNEDESDTGYYIRKSSDAGDISGDFNEYKVTETDMVAGCEVTLKGDGSLWSVAAWNANGYTYVIGCQSHPMSIEKLTELIKEMK